MKSRTRPIVDSHIHVWDPQLFDYGWLTQVPPLNRKFMPTDLDTGGAKVNSFVFVQADCSPLQSLAEVDWVSSLHFDGPVLSGIVAYAALEKGRGVRVDLEHLNQRSLVKGVRRVFQSEENGFITSDTTLRAAKEVSALGYTFDACVRPDQLVSLAEFAGRLPELPIVLDHMGKPPIADKDSNNWRLSMRKLATLPNVTVKLSGAAPEANPGMELAGQALPYLLETLELFGAERCMVGSDWPVSTGITGGDSEGKGGEYAAWLSLVLDHALEGASLAEHDEVAFGTATRFYGLESE